MKIEVIVHHKRKPSKNPHDFTNDEDMHSVSTNAPGSVTISSDSGEEFVVEQPYLEPIDRDSEMVAY